MAITASFEADFSQFSSEVAKAERDLGTFEAGAESAGQSLERMGQTSAKTAGPVNTLGQSYGQFNNALDAVGIKIGPQIRALDEMAQAAGKTSSQLGLLGTAGLVVSAALAGWQIGRKVAEFLELDTAIANSTAKLLGWGDVAAQTAGANADVLALASKRAGREITSLTEAMQVNQKFVDDLKRGATENAEALEKWKTATAAMIDTGQNWRTVLGTINGSVVEAIKFYLDAGVSQKTLADAYALSETQIKAVARALADEQVQLKAATKAAEESAKAITAAMAQHTSAVGAIVDRVFGVQALNQATAWVDAIDAMGIQVAQLSQSELADLQTAMLEGIDSLRRSGELTSEQADRFAELAVQAEAARLPIEGLTAATEELTAAQEDNNAVAAEKEKLVEATAKSSAAAGGISGPVRTDSGGAAYDLFGRPVVAPFGLPKTMGGTYGPVTVNVNGSVLSTADQLARAVGGALSGAYRRGGNRQPA